jgi:putative FmdB family regulatory protein
VASFPSITSAMNRVSADIQRPSFGMVSPSTPNSLIILIPRGTSDPTRSAGKGGGPVPTYSYKCRKCDHRFQEILSFKEYEEGKRKCPKCGSRSVEQILETFFAKTSRKA